MYKIHGEHTRPTDAPPLCHTCRAAMIVRGTRFGDDVIRCSSGLGLVRFHVTSCSEYNDARLTPVWAFEETAWRWMSTRFVSPAEFLRLNQPTQTTPTPPPASTASHQTAQSVPRDQETS